MYIFLAKMGMGGEVGKVFKSGSVVSPKQKMEQIRLQKSTVWSICQHILVNLPEETPHIL